MSDFRLISSESKNLRFSLFSTRFRNFIFPALFPTKVYFISFHLIVVYFTFFFHLDPMFDLVVPFFFLVGPRMFNLIDAVQI